MNAGYSFLGIVFAAGIIGFFIDKFAGTQPWALMGFLIIGFIYAVVKAQKEMNPDHEKTETSDPKDKNQK